MYLCALLVRENRSELIILSSFAPFMSFQRFGTQDDILRFVICHGPARVSGKGNRDYCCFDLHVFILFLSLHQ